MHDLLAGLVEEEMGRFFKWMELVGIFCECDDGRLIEQE